MKLAIVGMSLANPCGVRDHAGLLGEELEREGLPVELHWLQRSGGSLGSSRTEVRSWTRRLAGDLREDPPSAVLLHYSVFSYAHRGVPVFAHATISALRASGVPILSVLHEFAYPWRHGGLRGGVWALTQRAAVREVIGASAAVIVTTDFRASWVRSRRWLPRRRVLVAPVFSNLPPPGAVSGRGREGAVIGLFGYSHEGAAVPLLLDAVSELRARGVGAELSLLGAPGSSSPAGERWRAAADARGVADALSFSGRLPAQALSDALAGCDVLLFANSTGPTSRKTTLAASLASGVAVVAIDGPRRWEELVRRDAVRVVEPTSSALAAAIAELLGDDEARAGLGARGRAFAEQEMALAPTAALISALVGDVSDERSS